MVEVFTPNGQAAGNFFFIGSNAAGQTGPSYLAAQTCGINEPATTATIGYPGMHIVMNVTGTTGAEPNTVIELNADDQPAVETPAIQQELPSGDYQFRTHSSLSD